MNFPKKTPRISSYFFIYSALFSLGACSTGHQQPLAKTKELPPAQTKELPPTQTKELPPTQTKELPPTQTKELPPTQTKELPPTQTKELPPTQINELPPAQTKEIPPAQKEKSPSPCTASLTARHIEGGGIGYNKGYSTLEGLVFPIRYSNHFWPFLDLRAHRFDNNEYAANAGLGFRYNAFHNKIIFGLNTYFDYRTDHFHHFHFSQIGCGLEMLSRTLDVRINGYFPLKKSETIQHCVFNRFGDGLFIKKKKVEVALKGVDLEVGRSLKETKSMRLYGALGSYYYGGDVCRHTFGGKIRLNLNIFRYFFIDGSISQDHLYRTRVQGQVGLNFPIGCTSKNSRMRRKLTQPVQRNEIIALDRYCKWKWNF